MQLSKKVVLLAGLFIGLAGSGYSYVKLSDDEPQVVVAQASFVTDFSDDRRLVGSMDNVFLGRVVAQNTTLISTDYPLPRTEFTVEVVDSIKGDLSGEIVVRQDGGLDPATNEMILFEGDELLEVNGLYLLATTTCDDCPYQQAGAVYGTIKVAPSSNAPEIVARFEAAFANEILYTPSQASEDLSAMPVATGSIPVQSEPERSDALPAPQTGELNGDTVVWHNLKLTLPNAQYAWQALGAQEPAVPLPGPVLDRMRVVQQLPGSNGVEQPKGTFFTLVGFDGTLEEWLEQVRSGPGMAVQESTLQYVRFDETPAIVYQTTFTGLSGEEGVYILKPAPDTLLIIETEFINSDPLLAGLRIQ